jgi:hypothetical protein
MFCPFCGNEVKDGSVFCQKCGKRLVNEAANSVQIKKEAETSAEAAAAEKEAKTEAKAAKPVSNTPKKKLSKKALTGIIAGAAALVLAIILIVVLVSVTRNKGGKSNFAVPSGAIEYFEKDGYLYLVNSKGALTRVDLDGGELNRYNIKFDANNEKAVFAVERKSDNWLLSSSYDVYYYDGKSAVKIDEITDKNYYDDFQIFFTGNVVVYAKDDNIYSYSGGKSALIAEDAELSALSPDGKTIGYYKRTEDKVQGYYFTGGKEHFVINSGYPVFITNNADLVYIEREGSSDSSTFYVQRRDKENTRVKLWNENEVSSGGTVNYDGTQLLILKENGSYFCKNGKEPVKVSNKKLLPLIPGGVLGNGYMSGLQVIKDLEKAIYLERSGSDSYSSRADIVVLRGGKTEKVVSGLDLASLIDTTMSLDGRTYGYEDKEGLHYIRLAKDAKEQLVIDANDYETYFVDPDLTVAFYWNEFDELYFQKLNGKAVKVFDAGSNKAAKTSFLFGKKLYFVQDNTLYCSNGGKAFEVRKDVANVYAGRKVLLISDVEGNVYSSTDGKRFTKIADTDFIAEESGAIWD